MSGAMTSRILWKEFRAQAGFWLVAAVAIVALQILVYMANESPRPREHFWRMISYCVPALYALGCGACLFAQEREEGTFQFLRNLPLRSGSILAGKAAFGLASTLSLLLLALLPSLLFSQPDINSADQPKQILAYEWIELNLLLLALYCLSVGIFFSLLVNRVVNALWMTPLAVVAPFYAMSHLPFFAFLYLAFLSLSLLVVADCALSQRWFGEWAQDPARGASPSFSSLIASLQGLVLADKTRASSEVTFSRLLWLERQNARQTALAFCGVGLVLLVLTLFVPHGRLLVDWFVFAKVAGICVFFLTGLWTFFGEQRGRQFRFLTDRGISPAAVWWSKQATWFTLAVLLTGMLILGNLLTLVLGLWLDPSAGSIASPNAAIREVLRDLVAVKIPHRDGTYVSWNEMRFQLWELYLDGSLRSGILLYLLCYTAGQFCSLFVQRAVVAAFLGIILAGVLAGWQSLMFYFEVPWGFSVLPIPLALLLTTYVRTAGWLTERSDWQAWKQVLLTGSIPVALLLLSVATYRVFEIPFQEQPVPIELLSTTPPADETACSRIYASVAIAGNPDLGASEIWERTITDPAIRQDFRRGWKFATTAQRDFLAANQTPLKILQSEEFQQCLQQEDIVRTDNWLENFSGLLLLNAGRLEGEGHFAAAFADYLTVLRIARRGAAPLPDVSAHLNWFTANRIQTQVYQLLPSWAADPRQTPEQIREAIRRIEQEPHFLPPWNAPYLTTDSLSEVLTPADEPALARFADYLPFEKWRATRALRVLTHAVWTRQQKVETLLSARVGQLAQWEQTNLWQDSAGRPWKWIHTTPLLLENDAQEKLPHAIIETELLRKVTLVSLAVIGWRREHGRLPMRIPELMPTYLTTMPAPPWEGEMFDWFSGSYGNQSEQLSRQAFLSTAAIHIQPPFLTCLGRSVMLHKYKGPAYLVEYRVLSNNERWRVFPIPAEQDQSADPAPAQQ